MSHRHNLITATLLVAGLMCCQSTLANDVVHVSSPFGLVQSASAELPPGPVFAWGDNSVGQTNVPANLGEVVAIAAGSMHSLALRSDGSVVGWGSNGYEELTQLPSVTNVAAIAAGTVRDRGKPVE